MSRQRLSLTQAEAFALFLAAGNGADWFDDDQDTHHHATVRAFHRAQSKMARCYGFRDPHPELSLERAPRATPHRKTRQQSPELRVKRALVARLNGARRVLRRIGPEAEAVITDWLQKGLPREIAFAACQEIINNAAGLEEKIRYQASKGTPLTGMKLVYEQAAHSPSARRAIEIVERLIAEEEDSGA